METLIRVVLKFPRTIVAVALLLAALLGWKIPEIQVDPSVKGMLPEDEPLLIALDSLEATFGGSEVVIVAVESDNIFSRSTLEKIRRMTDELEQNENISRVLSITNSPDIVASEEGFTVKDLIERVPETARELDSLKAYIRTKDLIYGNLVSKDFRITSLICNISAEASSDRVIRKLFEEVRRKYEGPEKIYLAGLPLTRDMVSYFMSRDMRRFLPFGIALMIVLLVISFRCWIGVALPLFVVILSIIYTFGLMALFQVKFTFISILIPVMLIAIANDYGIHIIAHYLYHLREIEPGVSHKLAVIHTMRSLGTPVLMAGVTTLIGFLSLQSHVLETARMMGLFSAIGIAVALLLSMTLIPALLIILPEPLIVGKDRKQNSHRFAIKFSRIIIRYRIPIILLAVVFFIIMSSGIPRVVVDTNPLHYFHKSSEIRRSNELIERSFGGTTQLAIPVRGDIKDPGLLREMESFQVYLEEFPEVSRTVSIVDQLMLMNRAFHGDDPAYERVPETRNLIAQYLLLYSISGDPEDLDFWVDYDYRQAQIIARISETSSTKLKKFVDEANDYIDQHHIRENFTKVTGFGAILGTLVEKVVRGQVYSLSISLFLVVLITMFLFSSFWAGIYAIIPLSIAIVLVFGSMGFSGIELNVATAMLSSIVIGVGVDYTIHFLWRYRRMVGEGYGTREALEMTMASSGRGITYNALSVVVGFTVLTLSGFLPIYFFGYLIITSITTCWIGALTILPAIITLTRPRFIFEKKGRDHVRTKNS